jgi:hypothetical protein
MRGYRLAGIGERVTVDGPHKIFLQSRGLSKGVPKSLRTKSLMVVAWTFWKACVWALCCLSPDLPVLRFTVRSVGMSSKGQLESPVDF